jgi:hypothetical protein
MKKRGQMQIPFGMIFSIFLIVIFFLAAFFGIRAFLNIQKCTEVNLFYEELQNGIDNAWQKQTTNKDFKLNLPSGIEAICFANTTISPTADKQLFEEIRYLDPNSNVFLYPPEKACDRSSKELKHINLSKITDEKNPYCIDLSERDTIKLVKDYFDGSVVIE